MITTKIIDSQHKVDINILNEPFKLFGQILVSYNNGKWDYQKVFIRKSYRNVLS